MGRAPRRAAWQLGTPFLGFTARAKTFEVLREILRAAAKRDRQNDIR
jgi:hypothetical protein